MKYTMLVAALALSIGIPAAAEFETVAVAYELALDDVRLPQSAHGSIAFKTCSECPYTIKSVDTLTLWEINGEATTLDDFRVRVSRLSNPNRETLQVLHHLERDRVIRVWLYVH